MKEIFYAVQHGDCYDWDNGSRNYGKAVKMANAMAKDPEYAGEEIRIAMIDVEANYCLSVEEIAK